MSIQTKQLCLLVPLFSGCLLLSGLASEDCGDGFVDDGESCDDANTTPNDGCPSVCTNASIQSSDLPGLDESSLVHVIFGFGATIRNAPPGDEDTIAALNLFISDRPDLCERLSTLDPDFLADSSSISIGLIFSERDGNGTFPPAPLQLTQDDDLDPNLSINISVQVGPNIVTEFTQDSTIDAQLSIDDLSQTLSATFSAAILIGDISTPITIQLIEATECPFLSGVTQALLEQANP